MTPRERIDHAIRHELVDKVPVDLGSTIVTGITAVAYAALEKHLLGRYTPNKIVEPTQVMAWVDESIRQAVKSDTVGIYPGYGCYGWQELTLCDGTEVLMPGNLQFCPKSLGGYDLAVGGQVVATMPPGGYYFDSLAYEKWRDYDLGSLTPELLDNLNRQVEYWFKESDYALVINTTYTFFNGNSPDFLMALVVEKDEANRRLTSWSNNIIACLGKLLPIVNDCGSVLTFSGDIGTQKGPLIGPELYREMILPHFRKVTDFVHRNSDLKVFYHTCGSVYELIECFIEMGVDILNPLQVSADNMNPAQIVRDFGGRIVFWGGGCDTQRVLPEGTPADVRQEVSSRLGDYTRVDGYVFTPVHNILPDVGPENVVAMYEQVNTYAK